MQTCAAEKLGNVFLPPGLGRKDEENTHYFAQEAFKKADQ